MKDITEASKAILGILLRHPELIDSTAEKLRANDFADKAPRQTFEAIKAVAAKGAVDIITVDAELQGRAGNTVDGAYLIDCTQAGISAVLLPQYLDIVKDDARRRRMLALANRLAELAVDEEIDVTESAMKASAALADLNQASGEWQSMGDVLMDSFDELDRRSKGRTKPCTSGVKSLDELTGGFFAGELTILAARPSVGKTAMGLAIALASARAGHPVGFVSAEMVAPQIGNRVLTDAGNINGMRLRNAEYLQPEDWTALSNGMVAAGELPVQFLFERNVDEIVRQARVLKRSGCDMLVVDYAQLLTTRERFRSDWEKIGYVSKQLKGITTELRIPVIALAQLSRESVKAGGTPGLEALRGSGDLEQDADNVIIMHRVDDPGALPEEDRGEWQNIRNCGYKYLLFNVAKQRQGMVGTVPIKFDPAHMRYAGI